MKKNVLRVALVALTVAFLSACSGGNKIDKMISDYQTALQNGDFEKVAELYEKLEKADADGLMSDEQYERFENATLDLHDEYFN